jgi:dipeptidyl aminopeptidase/acylaminoacyl peptidase
VIWFSERDNWGQLYLYDLQTGRVKNQITSGEGNVAQLVRVDEKNRLLYFRGVGKEKGRDPYFIHFYRIGFDGKNLTLLTPEDAMHVVAPSPSGRYFVDSFSKADVAPTTVLRDSDGKLIATLERTDISRLVSAGWKPPEPIVVKARDGMTDLYGLLYRPTKFNPSVKYPLINHIYPGPQTGSVGPRNFFSRAAILKRLRNSVSSSSKSMGWGRRGGRRNSTTPTSATWATTPCQTRLRR